MRQIEEVIYRWLPPIQTWICQTKFNWGLCLWFGNGMCHRWNQNLINAHYVLYWYSDFMEVQQISLAQGHDGNFDARKLMIAPETIDQRTLQLFCRLITHWKRWIGFCLKSNGIARPIEQFTWHGIQWKGWRSRSTHDQLESAKL